MRFVDTLIVANEARFVNRHKLDCVVFFVLFLEVSIYYMGVHHGGV